MIELARTLVDISSFFKSWMRLTPDGISVFTSALSDWVAIVSPLATLGIKQAIPIQPTTRSFKRALEDFIYTPKTNKKHITIHYNFSIAHYESLMNLLL